MGCGASLFEALLLATGAMALRRRVPQCTYLKRLPVGQDGLQLLLGLAPNPKPTCVRRLVLRACRPEIWGLAIAEHSKVQASTLELDLDLVQLGPVAVIGMLWVVGQHDVGKLFVPSLSQLPVARFRGILFTV